MKKTSEKPETNWSEVNFRSALKSLDICVYQRQIKEHKYYPTKFGLISKEDKLDLDKHYLYVEWNGGGTSGGSCWDDGSGPDPHHSVSGEEEPEFEDLDTVLSKVCPNLSFLEYKQVVKIIQSDSYVQSEYYGNSHIIMYKIVLLRDLFNKLNELGLIL
jgi:hypothetical protein